MPYRIRTIGVVLRTVLARAALNAGNKALADRIVHASSR